MQAPRLLIRCVLGLAASLGACTSAASYVLVIVDARPAVHDAKALSVTLVNGGTMRTDTLDLKGQTFPVTFSVSAPGRTGDLAITVDAVDENSVPVGHGSAMTTVNAPTASVMLDSTDFVVNTDYAGDQFLIDDNDFFNESNGFQLATLPDGTWTVVFRDSCMQSACNVFARRFNSTGKPVRTQAAAGTNAFIVTARPSDLFTEPAVASSQTTTVATWNFTDPSPATTAGVACRTLSADGTLGDDQATISDDTVAAAVSVVALPTGDFVASWNAIPAGTTSNVIRMAIVKADCSRPTAVQTVSTGTTFVDRNAVAVSDTHVLFTWVSSGNLHALTASSAGVLAPTDAVLIPATMTGQVGYPRLVAATGGGFVLAVRLLSTMSTGPGKIELFQVSPTGTLVGSPALVTDQSGSASADDEGFGLASRPDGTVMVVWHTCDTSGSTCTVSGRIMKATGEPVTDAFAIPTTTGGSQRRPSVVGLPDAFAVVWSDTSGKPPDTAGQAVRARIIYPPGS